MSIQKETIIYGLIDPRTNQCRYIGKTTQKLLKRLQHHIRESKHAKHHRACWIKGLIIDGTTPEIFEIERIAIDENWKEAESFWISYFKFLGQKLVNRTSGGEGVDGLIHTDKSKKLMSVSHKGKILSKEHKDSISRSLMELSLSHPDVLRPNKGKKESLETRKKKSAALKERWQDPQQAKIFRENINSITASRMGIPLSAGHRENISKSHTGKILSDEHKKNIGKKIKALGIKPPSAKGKKRSNETKQKMSLAQKGKKLTEETKKKISQSKEIPVSNQLKDKVIKLFSSGLSQRKISQKLDLSRYIVKKIINNK